MERSVNEQVIEKKKETFLDKWIVREMNVPYIINAARAWSPSDNASPYASCYCAWGGPAWK